MIHTVLTMRAGGTLMVETGSYDTTTHKWNATSERPATGADVPYKLKPSVISLRQEIETEDCYFE